MSQPSSYSNTRALDGGPVADWMKRNLFPNPTPEDEKILQGTNQLIDQAGVRMIRPVGVSWADRMRVGRGTVFIPSDLPFIGDISVVIAERMRGKLEPEEWNPLIASSLLYYRGTLHRQLLGKVLSRVVLPLFLAGVMIMGLTYFLFPSWTTTLVIPLFFVLAFVAIAISAPTRRKAWLEADNRAAQLVGRESLLRTLAKIDSMGMEDVEKRKGGGLFSGRPSITIRLGNLQSC